MEVTGVKEKANTNISKTSWKCAECGVYLCNSNKRKCFNLFHTNIEKEKGDESKHKTPVFTAEISTEEKVCVQRPQKKRRKTMLKTREFATFNDIPEGITLNLYN